MPANVNPRSRPPIDPAGFDLSFFPALLFRTDHSNDDAWDEILDELAETEYGTVDVHAITGPAWEGATVDEILAAMPPRAQSPVVVYVADRTTVTTAGCPLLVVDLRAQAEGPREVRMEAGSVSLFHGNLAISNIGFWDLLEKAALEPDGIIRD
ncbi:DUF6924 domain-containing protein [Kineosporia babensis]|uniref:DUF6924 domain-containing protein n=1 Tax=Kineosporia babensis TaxID=499548 RepID=A0A9X1ND19_9ACTN|nr:hypothetical protein [Kineosporia babensis]MCD5312742.1 hypothetical protein [Kineosporia babensis]